MNSRRTRGGIGAAAPVEPDDEILAEEEPEGDGLTDPLVPRMAVPALDELRRDLDALGGALQAFGNNLAQDQEAVAQIQGQMAQVFQAIPNHWQVIQNLDRKMTAIAQQVARNTRRDALELAIKCPHIPDARSAVEAAEKFLVFLDPPQPQEIPLQEASNLPEDLQTPETKR